MNRRDLVNYMGNLNSQKENVSKDINPKDTTIYNIRKTDNGLYFNIKITKEPERDIKDLFIPSRFYFKPPAEEVGSHKIVVDKRDIVEYFLLYPGAIISLIIISAAILKLFPQLQNFFNFSSIF